MKPHIIRRFALFVLLGIAATAQSQTTIDVQDYFSRSIGLTQDEIAAIRNGQPVAKAMSTRSPSEVFVFGAVYINSFPESYLNFAYDMDRLRKTPGFLAVNRVSNPPKSSDFAGFDFGPEDLKSLKDCKPGDCDVQLPGTTIEAMRKSIDWSGAKFGEQVNEYMQNLAVTRLGIYLRDGNRSLNVVYNDKKKEVNVGDKFRQVLSKPNTFLNLPEFYKFLLQYPQGRPTNVNDFIYWSNVKFGLKPTLRIVQVISMLGNEPTQPALTIAEKQLYSSHYFETALNITYCVKGNEDPKQAGFYLIQVMGSEQAGLTGLKGSIVRKVAVGKSVSGLQESLAQTKRDLENPAQLN
jgi:hypothetical protein